MLSNSTEPELDTDGKPDRDLLAAYPNPFNPSTTVTFDVAARSHVSLVVFDVLGREVSVLENGVFDAGTHRAIFRADTFPSGSYMLRLNVRPDEGAPLTASRLILLHK